MTFFKGRNRGLQQHIVNQNNVTKERTNKLETSMNRIHRAKNRINGTVCLYAGKGKEKEP
jgi:hypothetical protein